ncbi:cysteine desulfurase-like protein [Bacillus carboniphilus]|uniref:Cysteine desulfurase-like protein n=1 Tax=Bacillus carboniphilus TaxID=86663 RepID=A0ABN0VUF3_9BACI
MGGYDKGVLFHDDLLKDIREKFLWIETDPIQQRKRLFFDNAGGSFRLKSASKVFMDLDAIPDCPEREHKTAKYLIDVIEKGTNDIRKIFNAKDGSIATYLTASQAIFEITGNMAENAKGNNIVTTALEHPSAYDAAKYYAEKLGKEFRVAKTNPVTGGVDTEEILKLIDQDTSLLSVIYASNISGAILDIESIVQEAKKINPNIYIIVDAVQHAPHGVLDVEKTPVDAINFAPYKFFGVRGSGIAYLSDRASRLPHHKLSGKAENEWSLGSPAPAHYAAISEIVDYICWIGSNYKQSNDRREQYVEGMTRISLHERALLEVILEGTANTEGLRGISGVTVHLDYPDLSKRDLIVAISIDGMDYKEAVRKYEELGVILFERVNTSIYSKRMIDSFGMKGAIRISPLHCHTVEEIEEFLSITARIAEQSLSRI